jgi:hypothetical protein
VICIGGLLVWCRRRAELARRLGERSTIGAISSKSSAKMSCSTNASRSGGDIAAEHVRRCRKQLEIACTEGRRPVGLGQRLVRVRPRPTRVPLLLKYLGLIAQLRIAAAARIG